MYSKGFASIFSLFALVVLGGMAIYLANNTIGTSTEMRSFAAGSGTTYYVSPNGNDTNTGTSTSPFKTLNFAVRRLIPGDTLKVYGGTYHEKFAIPVSGTAEQPITIDAVGDSPAIIDSARNFDRTIEINGSHVIVSHLTAKNSSWACVVIHGDSNTVSYMDVSGCESHGIYTDSSNHHIENNIVHDSVLENSNRSTGSGWGSALKMHIPSKNVVFSGNVAYHNYGEGIAITQGVGAVVKGNYFYDNYSVNLYIDNSYNVQVDGNLSTCTDNTGYTRDGKKPAGIALGEEYYSNWGSQLHDVTVTNNLVGYCGYGISFWGSDAGGSGAGLQNIKIANNTFYGGNRAPIYLEKETGNSNNEVVNNIFDLRTSGPWITSTSGINLHNNFWFGSLPSSGTGALGTGDIAGDPQFVTTPAYNNADTFKLKGTSPAINKINLSSVTEDYFGTQRPQDSLSDLGGYEFTSTNTTIGTPIPTIKPTTVPTIAPIGATPIATPRPTVAPTNPPTTNHAPVITTVSLPDAHQGVRYSQNIYGYDQNVSDSLNMNAVGLPKGLSFGRCSSWTQNNLKQIYCKVTGKSRERGLFTVTVTLRDSVGQPTSRIFSLKVN